MCKILSLWTPPGLNLDEQESPSLLLPLVFLSNSGPSNGSQTWVSFSPLTGFSLSTIAAPLFILGPPKVIWLLNRTTSRPKLSVALLCPQPTGTLHSICTMVGCAGTLLAGSSSAGHSALLNSAFYHSRLCMGPHWRPTPCPAILAGCGSAAAYSNLPAFHNKKGKRGGRRSCEEHKRDT